MLWHLFQLCWKASVESIGTGKPRAHVEYVIDHSDEQPGQSNPSVRAPQPCLPAVTYTGSLKTSEQQPQLANLFVIAKEVDLYIPMAEIQHQVHRTLKHRVYSF